MFDKENRGITTSGPIQDHNEDIYYNFLEEMANFEYQDHDCTLTDTEFNNTEFNKRFNARPTQKWCELSSDSHLPSCIQNG